MSKLTAKPITMSDFIQDVDNEISRIKVLIREKSEERKILKREIDTLENEKWKYEDLRSKVIEKSEE